MTGPVSVFTGEVKGLPDLENVRGPGAKLAFVQLLLADKCRAKSVELMDQLEAEKDEKAVADKMLKSFQAKYDKVVAEGGQVIMTAEEVKWATDNGIVSLPWNPGDKDEAFGESGWKTALDKAKAYVSSMQDNSQTLMVLIQDQLGQYNSFTQGASANIGNANTITQGLARW